MPLDGRKAYLFARTTATEGRIHPGAGVVTDAVAYGDGAEPGSHMTASIVIAPVADGRLEEWRAFHAELTGPRRSEWAESQRRRGVTREVVFLWQGPQGPCAVYLVEGSDAGTALDGLGGGGFDAWYRERMSGLHSELDLPARLSDTRPPAGSWRGWPRRRREPVE